MAGAALGAAIVVVLADAFGAEAEAGFVAEAREVAGRRPVGGVLGDGLIGDAGPVLFGAGFAVTTNGRCGCGLAPLRRLATPLVVLPRVPPTVRLLSLLTSLPLHRCEFATSGGSHRVACPCLGTKQPQGV